MRTPTFVVLFSLAGAATLFTTGCVTTPPPQRQTHSAGYVGDWESLPLGETVLTLSVSHGSSSALYNLHVRLGALVNPKDVSVASSYSYDVTGIIQRLEPR